MEFGQKMIILLWSLARWPISNQTPTQICMNLNFSAKKKWVPKRKLSKKCHVIGRNDRIWPKNDEPPMESCLLTHFQTKNCTNLCKSEFWCKMKQASKQKFSKKMQFQGPKWWNLAEKRRTSIGVLLVDLFLIKRLHKFARI